VRVLVKGNSLSQLTRRKRFVVAAEATVCKWILQFEVGLPAASQDATADQIHLMLLALYPTNALWNLAHADRQFNQHMKRDRLPKPEILERATPHLALAYMHYTRSPILNQTFIEDTALRFRVP
jgi:hypothetical protein